MPNESSIVISADTMAPEEMSAAIEAQDNAALESAQKGRVTATYHPGNGESRQVIKATPEPTKAPAEPAEPAEERPEYIQESEWKGSVKATLEALRSKEHFQKKEAEKKAEAKPEATPAGFFTEAQDQALDAELIQNDGNFSKETREAILKQLPGDRKTTEKVLDVYLRGRKAILENNTLIAQLEAGGVEAYAEQMKWFEQLPAAEQKLLSQGFTSSDREVVKAAAKTLRERYESANGRQGSLLAGNRGAESQGVKPYRSALEKQRDMNSLIYGQDSPEGELFREQVDARIRASYAQGIRV